MKHFTIVILILNTILFNVSSGLYIKKTFDNKNLKTRNDDNNTDKWSIFKDKLGLSNQKIQLLKSQKDQKGTLDLLNKFIEENPMYRESSSKEINGKPSNNYFLTVYQNFLKQLQLSRSTLKASLNFEIADKTRRKRSGHKIAVRMVSDMPSEKIDDLLKMFNEKYGINNQDNDSDIDVEGDYNEFPIPSAMDPDYNYENLYEDEKDLAVPTKSKHNSQYGSIQDLILQASQNQWQREMEESKLLNPNNEHFIQ